jgi:putative transposase
MDQWLGRGREGDRQRRPQSPDCVGTVHFLRAALAHAPRAARAMVAAAVRTIFEQPDEAAARKQLRQVCATLPGRFPRVVAPREEAEADILALSAFPPEHRRQVASTNPLGRLQEELKRRSAVVGIFPNRPAVLRQFGAILAEQADEWTVGRRYSREASMRKVLDRSPAPDPAPAVEVAA